MTDFVQVSLLDPPTDVEAVLAPTPGPVHHDGASTERSGANAAAIRAGALKHRILQHLADVGAHGANDFELHRACDPNGRVHSAANRRKELMDRFDPPLVETTAHTRPTDQASCEGLVHVLTEAGRRVLAELEEAIARG